MILEDRKIRYRLPTKIVSFGGEIENVDTLLKEKDDQIYLDEVESDLVKIKGPSYIILDFGEEIAGGVRLLVHYGGKETHKMRCRFRFGESLGEVCSEIGEKNATNHHALRDFENDVTYLSDQSYGDTGYRFLRIDILESEIYHPIKSIYAKEWYRDLPRINNFESEDKLSKQIFETCVHTLDLCMQGRVWDGIKRDRLVWIGDMEPEIHALLHVYGNIPLVEKTLETAVRSNPMPKWINNMPSYSAWFLLIIYDVFKIGKNKEIVKKYETYLKEIIHMFADNFLDNKIRFKNEDWNSYFIDWPSLKDDNLEERKDAVSMLVHYAFIKTKEMFQASNIESEILDNCLEKLTKAQYNVPKTKVFAAFYQLLHNDDESYQVLIKDGAKDMSTFLSYYVLKAVSNKDKNKALEMMKEYYGAMLDKGATTFWEDFEIDWAKGSSRLDEFPKENETDIHGDYGKHCYIGYRHSFCHGWSVGPISFLLEEFK